MEQTLRVLIALGLTLLLVLLRLDAQRFGAAEYDEPVGGRPQSVIRRLAWYGIGVVGVVAILFVHPSPGIDLHLTVGNPLGAVVFGLAFGAAGVAQAVALAGLRYRRLRFPDFAAYPGAMANQVATAFIDEATFRGALFGYLLWTGINPNLAIVVQALVYVLATRLGAPGRDRNLFILTMVIGLVGGWITLVTGGIGASFLAHAITRIAVFLTTGHAGQPAPLGRETEEIAKTRATPDGWRVVERMGGDSGREH
ncbi:MAG TPA: CPBP family intramembrane glutamic endopeptidase [Candidatus Eisenbacteria bacterium]|nr:CPBP family intramembrane glutamic endopeptidase [Candidatus Eisenbacteria bacterium]